MNSSVYGVELQLICLLMAWNCTELQVYLLPMTFGIRQQVQNKFYSLCCYNNTRHRAKHNFYRKQIENALWLIPNTLEIIRLRCVFALCFTRNGSFWISNEWHLWCMINSSCCITQRIQIKHQNVIGLKLKMYHIALKVIDSRARLWLLISSFLFIAEPLSIFNSKDAC